MEVDECHLASPLHHAPRRHRRVDAPGHERGHLAADAYRETAGPLLLVEVDQGLPGQYLHKDVDIRVFQADLRAGKLLYHRPQVTV